MSGTEDFSYDRQSRSLRSITGVTLWLLVVVVLWLVFGAAWWILALLILPALPAVYELGRNPRAGLALRGAEMSWFTGSRSGQVPHSDIDRIRMDTRWDFSVRVTVQLRSGKKIRLPDECLPPHRDLETVLQDRGIPVERHHFLVF